MMQKVKARKITMTMPVKAQAGKLRPECYLEEIKEWHIIPIFIKDNETVISHADFIESTLDVVSDILNEETILSKH